MIANTNSMTLLLPPGTLRTHGWVADDLINELLNRVSEKISDILLDSAIGIRNKEKILEKVKLLRERRRKISNEFHKKQKKLKTSLTISKQVLFIPPKRTLILRIPKKIQKRKK